MESHRLALPAGYRIENYEIQSVLGKGGFGITYEAKDIQIGRLVAIKELLPDSIATRIDGSTVVPHSASLQENWEWARERFLDEARVLAGFSHPSIVGVHRLIEANGTVYMVMDYVDGESYEARLRRIGREPDHASLMAVMGPVLDGLTEVHEQGLLHRDIKPENILINRRGQPVLIDFGSARLAVGATMTMTSIVTHGYSPIEQYQAKGKMGPWTDIYALGAVMCRAITGEKPQVAADRIVEDEFQWLSYQKASSYSAPFLQAVDWALRVRTEERPQKIADWGTHLCGAGGLPAIEEAGEASSQLSQKESSDLPADFPATQEPLPQRKQESKFALTAIVAAIVAAGALLAAGMFIQSRESDKRSEALRLADKQKAATQLPQTQAPAVATTAPAAQPQQATVDEASVFVAASEKVIAQANSMLEQADTMRAQGNLDGAFAALGEADYLVPGEPGILYQMAFVAFELGRLTDSRELAARAISMPAVRDDPNYSEVYQQLTILLSELGAPTGVIRDDAGIPIGSVFGIVEARLTDGEPGSKNLRIAIRASPTEEVEASDFKVAVYFYEQQDDGTIVETDANVMSEWLSPPIDWAEGEPEILELRYPMPSEDRGDMGDVQYHGYVVGIYFKGELQDSCAEPVAVLKRFHLPLTSAAFEPQE